MLLHGLGATSALQFTPTLCQLSAAFRVVAVDLRRPRARGRGLLASVADDVVALLDQLGVEEAVVLGYSVGGLVARRLAAQAPHRVRGLVLAATADPPSGAGFLRRPLSMTAGALARVPVPWPVESENGSVGRFLLGEVGRLSPAVLLSAVGDVVADVAPSPAALPVPVVFVVTTRDRLVRPQWQRRLAATRPDAPVLDVPAGHAASGLEPELFGPVALEACHLLTQPFGCYRKVATD